MKRRQFVATTVTGVAATGGLAGCLGSGGSSTPPPRRSTVVDGIESSDGEVVIDLVSTPRLESRADMGSSALQPLAGLLPIGRARGAKGGGAGAKGAVGRGSGGWSSAPHRGGHAVYHGGDYADDWRDDHDDQLDRYRAAVTTVGVARIGSLADDEDELPGVEPVPWDERYDVGAGEAVSYDLPRQGWYRTGIELDAAQYDHDFGWEFYDFEVVETSSGYEVANSWNLSPRL